MAKSGGDIGRSVFKKFNFFKKIRKIFHQGPVHPRPCIVRIPVLLFRRP
jgi:hypothetical protein